MGPRTRSSFRMHRSGLVGRLRTMGPRTRSMLRTLRRLVVSSTRRARFSGQCTPRFSSGRSRRMLIAAPYPRRSSALTHAIPYRVMNLPARLLSSQSHAMLLSATWRQSQQVEREAKSCSRPERQFRRNALSHASPDRHRSLKNTGVSPIDKNFLVAPVTRALQRSSPRSGLRSSG